MARKAIETKERRRDRASQNAFDGRELLRKILKDPNASYEEKMAARDKLNKKPRDGSRARRTRRCWSCGRAHGVYRFFGLCRCCIRKYAMRGLIPGLVKSSW